MKQILPLTMLMASTACGDTNNYYSVNSKDAPVAVIEIKTCEDVADRLYECNPQYFEDYKSKWGESIDKQKQDAIYECLPEKVDFFKNAPLWIKCISENSCDFINGGKVDWKGEPCDYLACGCGQYMPEY